MYKHIRIAAVAMIVVSLLASIYINYFRLQAEQDYRSVHILIDYDEMAALATSGGVPLAEVATRLKEAGATGVLIRERTLEGLRKSGDIAFLKGGEAALLQQLDKEFFASMEIKKEHTYIITTNQVLYENILAELQAMDKAYDLARSGNNFIISSGITEKEIEKMGLGFIPDDLESISDAGLAVVPRLRECSKSSEESLDLLAGNLKKMPGLAMITFNDPAITGVNNIPYLAQKLEGLDVPVGMFEFFYQAGLSQLARYTEKNIVRVHSISENDMSKYNERQAVDRFRLAVTERNIRALYIRLFGMDHPSSALDRSLEYISMIKEGIAEEGFTAGQPAFLAGIPYSRITLFLIGLGVVGGGILALGLLAAEFWLAVLGILGILGWAGFLYIDPLLARKSFALLSVIIYPILGVVFFLPQKRQTLPEAVISLLKMSAVSFCGAVIMTGLLADKSFMLTLDIFSGVKLAHLLPLVLIPCYYLLKGGQPFQKAREILDCQVYNKHILVGVVLAAALALYIIRTGNQAPQLVGSWEIALRDLLDQILGVRPRTKEFLLGHPAMLVLLYYGYDLRKIALLLLGIIGQVSLVNTYAHIHTPLAVSVIRTFHGLWMGIVLGLVAVIVLRYLIKWLKVKGALASE